MSYNVWFLQKMSKKQCIFKMQIYNLFGSAMHDW